VAAGAIAEKWLKEQLGIEIVAWVSGVGSVTLDPLPPARLASLTRADVDGTAVRCPDAAVADRMAEVNAFP
jgi:chorismate synthase